MKKLPWYVYAITGIIMVGFIAYVVIRFMGKGPSDVERYRIVSSAKNAILHNAVILEALRKDQKTNFDRKVKLENQIDSILNGFF